MGFDMDFVYLCGYNKSAQLIMLLLGLFMVSKLLLVLFAVSKLL